MTVVAEKTNSSGYRSERVKPIFNSKRVQIYKSD